MLQREAAVTGFKICWDMLCSGYSVCIQLQHSTAVAGAVHRYTQTYSIYKPTI